jgi:hypothetical protein
MTAKKSKSAAKAAADLNTNKVCVLVLHSLRGKYKMPYSKGHVVLLHENVAKELVDANDAEYVQTKEVKNIKVTDPTQV